MSTRVKGSRVIKAIYAHAPAFLRKKIEGFLAHTEEGWYFSETLREIYKEEYGLTIGTGSYGCFIPNRFPKGTVIGNYCSIARNVTVLNANHPMERASMHPLFYDARLGASAEYALDRSNLTVGHDVWIGQDVIVTKGCRSIGNGAIIGAGSVVTRDVEPYTVAAGNPARPIRRRFDEETARLLEESAWFKLSPAQLKTIADEVGAPRRFAEKAKELQR